MNKRIQTDRLSIVPFELVNLEDYYLGFDKDITKYQYPEPFQVKMMRKKH